MDAKPTNKILAQIKNMKNSSTSSFFLKTVNHLVTYSEVSIIQYVYFSLEFIQNE